MLNSEQIHGVLAHIADDTGISMILLQRIFPYDRYFITWKSAGLVMIGIAIFIIGIMIFFISEDAGISFFILPLVFLIEVIAFIKYIETCFIRKSKSELTIALFIKIILFILNKHRNELVFGVQHYERQLWRCKIYEVLK